MTRTPRHGWSALLAGVILSLGAALLAVPGPATAATTADPATSPASSPASSPQTRPATSTVRAERAAMRAMRATWRVNGTVYDIAVVGRRVYVGGDFDRISSAAGATRVRHNLVAFRRGSGRLVPGWNGSTNGPVRSLAPSTRTGRLFVGGGFTQVGNRLHRHVAAVSLRSGNVVNSWRGSTNGPVRDIVLYGRRVYLAGAFFQVRGTYQHGVSALTVRRGARVAAFRATLGPRGQALALALSRSRRTLTVGGTFTRLSQANRRHLGEVRLSSGSPTRWRPAAACGGCGVLDLRADARRVYASMSGRGGRVVAYRTGNAAVAWSTRGNGDVQALALSRRTLFVGGHFTQLQGRNRMQAASLKTSTGGVRAWRPPFRAPSHPGVWAIAPGRDFIRVGGAFRRVGGTSIRGYVEFRVR